jgi:hypothetical protein
MTYRCTGQSWALDIALAQGGFDALHPEAKGTLQQLGHDPTDFDRVFDLVKSGAKAQSALSLQLRSGMALAQPLVPVGLGGRGA